MRQKVFWVMLVTLALLIGIVGENRVFAQRFIDPAPADDGPELAADLPLPERSLVVEQSARDNSRAFFGVTFDPKERNAAVARSVSAGSPADEAGVLAGDTIISMNGTKTATYDEALQTIGRLKPGDVLDVEVSRRVNVRARAVLDGTPVGFEHTAGYHAEAEPLPSPAGYQNQAPAVRAPMNRAPVSRAPSNVNSPRPRQGYSAPQNRNTEINRGGNSNRSNNSNGRDQDDRGRGGFFRRGRQ